MTGPRSCSTAPRARRPSRPSRQASRAGSGIPKFLNITNEHEAYVEFAKGNMATVMHSESEIHPTEKELIAAGKLQVRQFPGIDPGTTGSAQGADGTGVNKWTKQPEASWSYFNRLFTPGHRARRSACTSPSSTRRPATRCWPNPEVIAAQYLIPAHTAQAKGVTNLWSTPYNYSPGLRRRRQQDDQGRVQRDPGTRGRRQGRPGRDHQVPERLAAHHRPAPPAGSESAQGEDDLPPCAHVWESSLCSPPWQPTIRASREPASPTSSAMPIDGSPTARSRSTSTGT